MSRTANARRNIVWGLIGKIVAILGPFAVRTALIYALGAEYLGVSSLCTSVLQLLSLAELGFATAVVYSMYKPVAEGDTRQIAAYLNYFKAVYRWVGLAILALGLLVMPFIGYLVKGSWPDDVNMQLAFGIYLLNACLGYFLFAYKQSLLNAFQRNDAVSKVNMAVMTLQYGLQVAVLLIWPNFYAFAIVIPACTVLGNVLVAVATGRMFPEYSDTALRREALSAEGRRDVRKLVAGLMIQRVCGVTRDSFDSVVISAFLGLTVVACYGNYFVILSGVHAMLAVVLTSVVASVGNSVATESKQKNFDDMRLFVFLYAVVSIVCAAVMMTCYQPFMELWVGEDLVLPMEIPVLMVAYFYVLTMGDIRATYVDATGIWWEQRWRAIIESIANLALNLLLVQLIGLPGVILGTLISLLVINFIYGSHLAFKYYFGLEKARLYYIDHAIYLGVAVAVCTATYAVSEFAFGGGGGHSLAAREGPAGRFVRVGACGCGVLLGGTFQACRCVREAALLEGRLVSACLPSASCGAGPCGRAY